MPAPVLVPLPVSRPKGPTVEATKFFPRPGREAPPRLQAVPNPFESERTTFAAPAERGATWEDILRMRGELPPPPAPRPTRTKAAPVAPWNRKGFVYPEPADKQGKWARINASCNEDMPRIRATPKNLAALLKLPEWKGARVVGNVPSPEIGQAEREVAESAGRVAESEREIESLQERLAAPDLTAPVRSSLEGAMGRALASLSARQSTLKGRRARLEAVRAEDWIHVVHPSGAEIRIRPRWGVE